jgi:hypothetical protein
MFAAGRAPPFLQPFVAGGINRVVQAYEGGTTFMLRRLNSQIGGEVLLPRRERRDCQKLQG